MMMPSLLSQFVPRVSSSAETAFMRCCKVGLGGETLSAATGGGDETRAVVTGGFVTGGFVTGGIVAGGIAAGGIGVGTGATVFGVVRTCGGGVAGILGAGGCTRGAAGFVSGVVGATSVGACSFASTGETSLGATVGDFCIGALSGGIATGGSAMRTGSSFFGDAGKSGFFSGTDATGSSTCGASGVAGTGVRTSAAAGLSKIAGTACAADPTCCFRAVRSRRIA